jgi:hypothetical protein
MDDVMEQIAFLGPVGIILLALGLRALRRFVVNSRRKRE